VSHFDCSGLPMVRSATCQVHGTITCRPSRAFHRTWLGGAAAAECGQPQEPLAHGICCEVQHSNQTLSNTNSELYRCTNLLVQTMVVCKCPLSMTEDRALLSVRWKMSLCTALRRKGKCRYGSTHYYSRDYAESGHLQAPAASHEGQEHL